MADVEQPSNDTSATSGQEQAPGNSDLGVTDDALGNRAQQGDLLGDHELGATEALGEEQRDTEGDRTGGDGSQEGG